MPADRYAHGAAGGTGLVLPAGAFPEGFAIPVLALPLVRPGAKDYAFGTIRFGAIPAAAIPLPAPDIALFLPNTMFG